MTARTVVKVLALCAAVMLFAGIAAYAQEGTTSATVTVGGQVISGDTDSSRFEQYEEWPEGVMVFGASFDWMGKTGYYLTFEGTDVGYEDNNYFMEWGKKSTFKLQFTWDETPRWFSNKGRSFWNDRLPNELNYLNYEVAPVDLRVVRQTGGVAFNYIGLENWDFNLAYTHETRDGKQPFMTAADEYYEVFAPVNYYTQVYSGSATWSNGKWFGGASYNHSSFRNKYDVLSVWDDGASAPYLYNLAPDSTAYNFSFFGGVNLPYHHRIVATIDWGKIKNDRTMIPNAYGLDYFHGKNDTFLANVRITGEPIKWFGYSLHYRAQDLEDKTPYYLLGAGTTGARGTRIAGYTKDGWGGEIHFDPIEHVRFGLEYKHEKTDHQFREFHNTKENSWKANLDLNWAPWVSFKASYTDLTHKDGGINHEYEELLFPAPATIPRTWGGTFFDIERRDSKIFNAMLIVTPVSDLNLWLSTQSSKDKYPHAWFGLQNYKYSNWGFGLDYAWSERLTLYANYMDENYDSNMWAMYMYRQAPISAWENQWGHTYDDSVDTYTLGFDFDAVPGRFDFSTDYAYSKGKSASQFYFVPGGSNGNAPTASDGIFAGVQYGAYPLVWNKYTKWTNRFNYHFNKNLTGSVAYIMQKYSGEDWAQDLNEPLPPSLQGANLSAWRLLGAYVPDYDADIFQVYVKFTF